MVFEGTSGVGGIGGDGCIVTCCVVFSFLHVPLYAPLYFFTYSTSLPIPLCLPFTQVFVPSANCYLALTLGQVRCPLTGRGATSSSQVGRAGLVNQPVLCTVPSIRSHHSFLSR